MSVAPRLNRLFGADGKCFEVAMDHGVRNEPSFLPGIENLEQAISTVAAAQQDAILLSMGQAHLLQDLAGKEKPSLVVRADPTNLYNTPTPRHVFCHFIDDAVGQALALDPVSIVVNLLWTPDQPDLYHQCLENVSRVNRRRVDRGCGRRRRDCRRRFRKGHRGRPAPSGTGRRLESLRRIEEGRRRHWL